MSDWGEWVNYRRLVTVADDCATKARELYPPGGSVDGRPRYDHFVNGPLDAAKLYFGRRAELFSDDGDVDAVVTAPTPFFPPIVFYAAKTDDNIQILDFEPDDDYWDLLALDPFD